MSVDPEVSAEMMAQAWNDPRMANVLYHDWEASTYDPKWAVSYDDRIVKYARDRFVHAAGGEGWPYARSLEVGCGTGFFTLNLIRAGVLTSGVVTDISPGMVEVAVRNARGLGVAVDGRVADAERVPYADAAFDLVIGHAVLHRIPDVEQALREALRVLRPGGRFVFCGEPTGSGDLVGRQLANAGSWVKTSAANVPWVGSRFSATTETDGSGRVTQLREAVEVHAFAPAQLRKIAIRAGAVDVSTVTEELTSRWFDAPAKAFEAALGDRNVGRRGASLLNQGRSKLADFDSNILERIVPERLFATVAVTGVKH
ncbi:MAG: class I SAM-dependent methyltransferase [Candidatus Nanopelagicales bacterium]